MLDATSAALWGQATDGFSPRRSAERFDSPGALAAALDPTTVATPALDLIDDALVDVAEGRCDRLMISMSPQEGKLVADATPVPTPDGWTAHGELRVGDWVLNPSGRPVRVTAVHEPAMASMVVRTSDHAATVVHPRHEWTVFDRSCGRWRTVETQYLVSQALRSGPTGRGGGYRFHLPLREPVQLPDADLPLDPYTLGVWLGDGSSSKAAITHHPDDEYVLPYPESARCVHNQTGIVTTYYAGGLRADLQTARVWNNKHIPPKYLRGSEKQRRALLAGLIDTDGHVVATGQVSFDNSNERLVRDVAELVRTLGYRAHVHRPTPPKLSTSGIQGILPMWRMTYTPHDEGPARLARKAPLKLGIRRRVAITAIEPCEPMPGRCITVDSPDGLYLVGQTFIPTHNSQRTSRRFPHWMLLRNPDTRIALVSNAHTLARRWGRAVRDDIAAHPELGLNVNPQSAAAHEWELAGYRGGMYCVGVKGQLTGRPVDLLIIDDPYKDGEQADSELWRETVRDFWTEVAIPRLGPNVAVCIIQTRWRHDDLSGWLQERDDGITWRVINIPAQADHRPEFGESDPLDREPGEYMISARGRTPADWDTKKREVGSRAWNALYQGKPSPGEGLIFHRHWWQRYSQQQWIALDDGTCHALTFDELIQSWDMAFKDTAGADYVVGQVWGRRGDDAYLLDQVRARMSFVDTCMAVRALSAKWPQAHAKLVEDKANGTAVISQLKAIVPGLIPVEPGGTKVARASAVSPFVEAGNVWVPAPEVAAWSESFVDEHAMFPLSANDDQVDAMSQALNRLLLNAVRPRVRFLTSM